MTEGPLERASRLLTKRLEELEARLHTGDGAAWQEYRGTVQALATVQAQVGQGRKEFLTTKEMAERLGLSPKTLLRRKAKGDIRPTVQRGKLIRWKNGDEVR